VGDIATIATGKVDVNAANLNGRYPFFTCSRAVYRIDDAPYEGKAILVAGNGDLNVKYYEGRFNAYQRTYFLFAFDEQVCLPKYLYWFLESHLGVLRDGSSGSTIRYIRRGDLSDARIPLPALTVQQRIVAKLDVAIDIVSELEQVTFERRRLFGEFARSWLAGVLERTGGKVEKLGDLASVDYGERVVRARDGGSRYLAYGGGGATFSVDRSNRRDCFIISRFGMSEKCVRYVEGEFFLNDSGLSVSTRDEESLRQEFLDRVLLARQAEIYSLGAGTAQRNLDINKFKQMQLTVPPVEVQDTIVAEYDAVSGVCGTAEQSYSHRAGSFRSLRQSVLAAAFGGEL